LGLQVRTAEGEEEEVGEAEEDGEQVIGVELRGTGRFEVRVNSWAVQQREVACEALLRFVTELSALVTPFLPAVLPVALELLAITATPDVRLCAYGMLPRLMRAACRHTPPSHMRLGQEALEEALPRLSKLLLQEAAQVEDGHQEALESLCVGADCLSDVLKVACDSHSEWRASLPSRACVG
jgi:hypothetical protein